MTFGEICMPAASEKPAFRRPLLDDKVASFEYNEPVMKFTE
jgi:hypothetical protein